MFQGPPNTYLEICARFGTRMNSTTWELVQIQAVEYREKQNQVYKSLNKRLVSSISKEQEGEIEPPMFMRNVALNLELR